VLSSEADMAAFYLADARDGVGGRLEQHSEIEILLENYARRLDELRNGVSELQGFISATEAYLKIRYDGQRNKIMRQTLLLSMATFSVGAGTAVSSVFGMNLLSGFEHHPQLFWAVAGGVALSSGSVFALLFASYKRNSQFKSRNGP
jgi:magnesium transporter